MMALQLEPSAHAPCTRTMFGSALIWLALPGLGHHDDSLSLQLVLRAVATIR
jgi:hypothetical protein